MLRRTLLLLFAGLSLLPCTPEASAQFGAVAGVDGQRLRLGVDSMAVFLIRGRDTIPTGTVRDELSLVLENGVQVLQRVYRSQDRVMGVRVDTLLDEHASLLALGHRSRTGRSQQLLSFSAGRAVGWIRLANGDSSGVDVGLPSAVYNGSSFDLVLRAAPLAEGWSTEVPAFIASTGSMVPLRAWVAGRESIAGESCWRLDADFGGSAVTFWVHEQSRDLCQQVMYLDPTTSILFQRHGPSPSRVAPRPTA